MAEFLQDDPTLQDDRKQRRKKERSSIFFRKKKDKAGIGNSSSTVYEAQQLKGGLSKVSSSKNLGSKAENQGQGSSKLSQHSQSMSSLRKSSISAPSLTGKLFSDAIIFRVYIKILLTFLAIFTKGDA